MTQDAALLVLIFIGNVHTAQERQLPTPTEFQRHDFDWQLAREVFRDEDSNVVFSPFSVKLLLTLLYEAAEPGSATHQQLKVVLCERDINETRTFYNEFLDTSTKANDNYEFDIGTKVFLDKLHGKLSPSYTNLLQQTYSASFDRVSFNGTAKKTAGEINDWCEKVTRGRITEIVTEDTLLESQMILANVLFLKASWRNSFLDKDTVARPFEVSAKTSVMTPFMTQTDLYEYANHTELGAEVLRLPYKGRDFSMNIVLPHGNVSLDSIANSMSTVMLKSLLFQREDVTVHLPKFRFDYGTLLNEPLRKLGIRDIFNQNASLPLLAPITEGKNADRPGLEVSKILQKAGIEINEKGTLASAATEIQLVSKFGYDDLPIVFNVSRPFLFYIHDQETDTILFLGKVTNPSTDSYRNVCVVSASLAFIHQNHSPLMLMLSCTRCDNVTSPIMALSTPRKSIRPRFTDYQPYQGTWNDEFDWGVTKEVLMKAPGNAVLSPLSVKVLLALLYEGSASVSETQRELLRALGGRHLEKSAIDKLSEDILRYKQQGNDLLIADRIFYDQSVAIVQKFHSIITTKYNATTESVDFQNNVGAAEQINQWVAQNTREKITDVVKPDALQDAILMLINTIYFKGSWAVPFPTNATVEKPFHLTAKASYAGLGPKTATFMKQREHIFYYKYSEQLKTAFLRLPYQGNQLSMMVMLPDAEVSLDQLLSSLTPPLVHQVLQEMEEEEVEIELPKFSITYASSMRECLQQLGVSRVFSDQAELPLISRGRSTPLKVSTILQKSCIKVDEEGTEAAAATEGTLVFTILNQPVQFFANRPFLFLIYDEGQGNWLFAGKVVDPTL
ncbi:uncharacterized protein LOC131294420 [Anopheles ziemanni]|uniref:uncharacterized protein LOC131294420 n=1 Tax=Anopheles ziemanni TaxID=345580 RepID=UPI00265E9659|nr:uncharacterized protein LOC131294420 [Anopheles ziemanni]